MKLELAEKRLPHKYVWAVSFTDLYSGTSVLNCDEFFPRTILYWLQLSRLTVSIFDFSFCVLFILAATYLKIVPDKSVLNGSVTCLFRSKI